MDMPLRWDPSKTRQSMPMLNADRRKPRRAVLQYNVFDCR